MPDPPLTFSDREIRDVFERAAAAQARAQPAEPDGLTLAEMVAVGEAAGLDPALVEAAAWAVRHGEPSDDREALGPVPVGVRHTAYLADPPSDALWERIAADARRTFNAPGKESAAGPAREWRNGNLRVGLEPAGAGSRLALRSRRPDAGMALGWAAFLLLLAVTLGALALLGVGDGQAGNAALLGTIGAALGLGVGLRQRSWAARREAGFRQVAARAGARRASEAAPAPAVVLPDALEEPGGDAAPAERKRTRA